MTRQEKIREGINDILRRYRNFVGGYDADGDELDIDGALGAIFSCLVKEGCVLKVDRELPCSLSCPKCHHLFGSISSDDMALEGYVAVESLIEEKK